MLFSSFSFILAFLPLSLLAFFLFSRVSQRAALFALLIASSIFYSWGNPISLLLIYFSILFNYYIVKVIRLEEGKFVFVFSLIVNVVILVFFKYSNFIAENLNALFLLHIPYHNLPLPLGISFFTFQQIGFLVEAYKKKGELPTLITFANFVTFFPQLIAGPVVKHTDYLPQLESPSTYRPSLKNLSVGSTIFVIGLFKKTVLADSIGRVADLVFGFPNPNMVEAWIGLFSYSFQIYFDFSGYSDMAIGLARMFNIHLPCNFLSPYQSESLIEFWKRWHISLSTFLKEHIYIPLGGNRCGTVNRYANLFVTMLIGGLWHGASWTFVVWGGLHGMYLILNHLIRQIIKVPLFKGRLLKQLFVFVLVSVAWIFFRADNLSVAMKLIEALVDPSGLVLPSTLVDYIQNSLGLKISHFKGVFNLRREDLLDALILLPALFCIAFFSPNTYEWMAYFRPAKNFLKSPFTRSDRFKKICWKPTVTYGVFVWLLLIIAFGNINSKNEFIYFRF